MSRPIEALRTGIARIREANATARQNGQAREAQFQAALNERTRDMPTPTRALYEQAGATTEGAIEGVTILANTAREVLRRHRVSSSSIKI